jgi:hypothetical protein
LNCLLTKSGSTRKAGDIAGGAHRAFRGLHEAIGTDRPVPDIFETIEGRIQGQEIGRVD